MSNSKELFVRIGVGDILLPKDEESKIPKYITIKDAEGNELLCIDTYFVCYEDEDGEEIED